jgi:hypothetical protein
MTLSEAAAQVRARPDGQAIRPVAWRWEPVGLTWSEDDHGWIGRDFTSCSPRVIVDEYRLSALGLAEWEVVTVEQLRAEAKALLGEGK